MVLSPIRINLLKPSVIWAACLTVIAAGALWAQAPTGNEIPLVVGKSIVLDIPDEIQRVSITDDTIADVVAISTREILINAKGEGITTLVLWSRAGDRNFFTINVGSNLQQVQDLLRAAFPGEQVRLVSSQGLVTLNGSVSAPEIEERMLATLSGMGAKSVVSNLELPIPAADRQIVLRVRFVEVQRNALSQFGANILSTGALNMPGSITTQQFSAPRVQTLTGAIGGEVVGTSTNFSLTDTLNIFAFRPDLNLGILLKALESRGISQLLAEPNVVTTSGKEANLLIGGEFPVPIIQGGAGAGAVTIQFREFGIRINFLPEFTERGSIRMHVRPEVSALDFANAVTLQGFLIPALSTRRVETDVELMPGQSFVIGGLIDARVTESENRVPVLSKIPLLGEIFKSRSSSKNNSELLVLVTPEFPEVYESGEQTPTLGLPEDFLPPLTDDLDWKK
jgi:pilus assembly protein CpaC